MSSLKTVIIESTDAEMTENLAAAIGKTLRGGETLELVSDLGGGKTTFVRGLVRGMGSDDKVASPTFTVSKFYRAGKLEIHHFDFYRLAEPGIVANELAEVVGDPQAVVVVEWAEVVQRVLPEQRMTLTIEQTPTGSRKLTFTVPEELEYMIKDINS